MGLLSAIQIFFGYSLQIKCLKKDTKSISNLKEKAKHKRIIDRQAGHFVRRSESIATYAVSKVINGIKYTDKVIPFMLWIKYCIA